MNKKTQTTRRNFLRGVGGVALGIPLLGSLAGRVLAAPTQPIKRLIILFTPNGVNMDRFFPNVASGQITAASLQGRALEPMSGFADRLLVPRGIHMAPRGFNWDELPGDDHMKGMACKLTAQPTTDPDIFAAGESVDFAAARSLNIGGKAPLVIQVGRNGNQVLNYCSYSGPQTPYAGENNPYNVYRAFTGLIAGSEGDDRVMKRGQSLVDLVRDDLNDLKRTPMSSSDTKLLDDWLALVRDVETGMGSACSPDTVAALDLNGVDRYDMMDSNTVGSDGEFNEVARLMMKLTALTMACDVNRVATIKFSSGASGPTFRWDGMNHEFNHHQLSHRNGRDDAEGGDIPGIENFITEVDTYYASRMNDLLSYLDMFTGDGGTMLDDSVVMWISELSDGKAHDFRNLPVVIAGSGGGYLKQGQVIDCSRDGNLMSDTGAAHNRLLTSLLNAVGATDDSGKPYSSFGDLSYGEQGEFDQLKA
ncbi:MAG: DUF1552 domain-containing protein [Myxococcales bacterium]|nr:DUF1552 domain-containing protein [Myxococcales bacterium]